MHIQANTVDEYLAQLQTDRKEAVEQLRKAILSSIPEGFEEVISYGMIGYVVPLNLYPSGYLSNPATPLPFINIASQKNHLAVYHMGLVAMPELLSWFTKAYALHATTKLDMGKSCIRFKPTNSIPYKLIAELASKVTVKEWVEVYEKSTKRK